MAKGTFSPFDPLWPMVDKLGKINATFWRRWLEELDEQSNALINLATDVFGLLSVANGGTNRATLTDHAVLVGSGSLAVDFVVPSTVGFVLTDNGAGADPSFQAPGSSALAQAAILTRVFVNC